MDLARLRGEADKFIQKARIAENEQKYREAIFYYTEAIDSLQAYLILQQTTPDSGSIDATLAEIDQLLGQAEAIKPKLIASLTGGSADGPHLAKAVIPAENQDLELAKFLFERAMAADEDGLIEDAANLYIQSVEIFLKISKSPNVNPELQTKARKFAKNAIERAEEIKRKNQPAVELSTPQQASQNNQAGSALSKEEIQVLYQTSTLNGVKCLPFMPIDVREEKFVFQLPYIDSELPGGVLPLSSKQTRKLAGWVRLSDLSPNPQILGTLSPNAVKQTVVSDCSFVASLSVAAQCERKFRKPIISPQIYPKDRSGQPVYNPCGKYMIKLHLNGVWRKIIIDDQLPVDKYNRLLCSYSQNPNEFWVSLLEKAYMKVMGGYDFPGSNSSIDLNALTGWIPERLSIHSDVVPFDRLREFDRMLTRFHKGDCLITVATGDLSKDDEERTGLVPSHAYAVMDLRLVDGMRLLMVKNPWSHLRWKGKFSENDTSSWTLQLQAKLGYDPRSAQLNDNGIFWIDYDSLCHFFDVFYLSWNPSLFPYNFFIHETWLAGSGPRKDAYDMSGNPQFKLRVKSNSFAAVWLILTRHITDRNDFAENREFITLLVFKTAGRRVFYPSTPPPFIDGVRINSPHYLCKLTHDCGKAEEYTLVVSQFDKSNTLHFTLNAYGSCEFELTKIVEPYRAELTRQLNGEWRGLTAGGCSNSPATWKNNPVYCLSTEKIGELLVTLKGPRQYSVGFAIFSDLGNGQPFWSTAPLFTSGPYRSGFSYLELEKFSPGNYFLVPTTFNPGEEGPYILEVKSSVKFDLRPKLSN